MTREMTWKALASIALALLFLVTAGGRAAVATDEGQPAKGTLEHIKVHGKSLEGNLEGDSPDRDVVVYLPPSYQTDTTRHYPVLYVLHGYSIGAAFWSKFLKWPENLDTAMASGQSKEMILVMPDAKTLHNGSMYSNSVTTGNWEGYITKDLVDYVDSHYRTIPDRMSRGLTGHSMGGYGTVRIGMKYPEVFSSIYAMSSCCLPPRDEKTPGFFDVEKVKTVDEAVKGGFGIRTNMAAAAAWSPNPTKPPLYVDMPTKDGKVDPLVVAKWAANAPLAMVDQYVFNLKRLHAIGLEVGTKDAGLPDTTKLHQILDDNGVANVFETYDGNHTNHITERFVTKVLPFFSKELSFPSGK